VDKEISVFSKGRLLGAVAFVVFSLFSVKVSAQYTAGTVQGTVFDSTGAVVPGATVVMTNAAGSAVVFQIS